MILIWSRSCFEPTTENVMDWLEYYGAKYLRLNEDEFLKEVKINTVLKESEASLEIESQGKKYSGEEIKVVWFRRELFRRGLRNDDFEYANDIEDALLKHDVKVHLGIELKTFSNAIVSLLANKRWVDWPDDTRINKIDVLRKAQKIGLDIPQTLITNNNIELQASSHPVGEKKYITKPISEGRAFRINNKAYALATTSFTDSIF